VKSISIKIRVTGGMCMLRHYLNEDQKATIIEVPANLNSERPAHRESQSQMKRMNAISL